MAENKKLYIYDGKTGQYLRSQDLIVDTLETTLQGKIVYVSYPNSTTEKLPKYGEHELPYFKNGKWTIKGQWKDVVLYNTKIKCFEVCETDEKKAEQVFINDKKGIERFIKNPDKYRVNKQFKIVTNPLYEDKVALDKLAVEIENCDIEYAQALDTPVLFTNKCLYKPKWVDDGTYSKLITAKSMGMLSFPQVIWDSTELEENAREMSEEEFLQLCNFLAIKQQTLFNERKLKKSELLKQYNEVKVQYDKKLEQLEEDESK